jgi:two-component system LytT family response regulator
MSTTKIFDNFINDKFIALPVHGTIELIEVASIIYLEADGKYTTFYLLDNIIKVVSKNIGFYEDKLPTDFFFRIHHKFIVNFNKVSSIKTSDGNYCTLNDNKSLSISKRKLEPLRKFLNLKQ